MTDIHEGNIAEQVDREVASRDGLLALVICFSATVGLAVAGVVALMGAF
jgi:hypothetical protein